MTPATVKPKTIIQRTNGASATYGSQAVAGVAKSAAASTPFRYIFTSMSIGHRSRRQTVIPAHHPVFMQTNVTICKVDLCSDLAR